MTRTWIAAIVGCALALTAVIWIESRGRAAASPTPVSSQAPSAAAHDAGPPAALNQQAASIAGRMHVQSAKVDRALARRLSARSDRLRQTIDSQYEWLSTHVNAASFPLAGDPKPIAAVLADHYWVVATIDG